LNQGSKSAFVIKDLQSREFLSFIIVCLIFVINVINNLLDLTQFLFIVFFYSVIICAQLFRVSSFRAVISPLAICLYSLILFETQMTDLEKILLLSVSLSIFVFMLKPHMSFSKIDILPASVVLMSMQCLTVLFANSYRFVLQFLGLGYDNAFHLTVFRGYRLTSWFPEANSVTWWTDFDLFMRAPTGSSALFSFSSNILIGSSHDPFLEMSAYAVLLVSLLVAISYIFIKFMLEKRHLGAKWLFTFSCFLGIILIVASTSGVLLVNGFPPYLLVTLILAYWLKICSDNLSSRIKLLYLSLAAFCISLITPGPIAFLILPGIALLIDLMRQTLPSKQFISFFLSIAPTVLLAALTLVSFTETSGTFGWRQILAPGGVHQPNLYLAGGITLLFLVCLVSNLSQKRIDLLWLTILSGGVSVGLLAVLTLINTGSIQYYAVKQLYVWLPLAAVLIYREFLSNPYSKGKILSRVSATTLSLIAVLGFFNGSQGGNGWMGTLPSAGINVFNQETWPVAIIDADLQIQSAIALHNSKDACRIFRLNPNESDLNSRWANALTNPMRMSSECFGGYWNSSSLTAYEVIDRLGSLDENFLLVFPLSEKAILEKLSIPANIVIRYQA
jgi:hypothetical protein